MSHRDIATDYASEALAQRARTAALGYQIVACDLGNMGWFALVRQLTHRYGPQHVETNNPDLLPALEASVKAAQEAKE